MAFERDFLKGRLGSLPLEPARRPSVDDGDESDEREDGVGQLLPAGAPTTLHPRKLAKLAEASATASDTSPLSATAYFETALEVEPGFRAYYTAPRDARGTVFVGVHGAGYSGLSFACLADELRTRSKGKVGCLAYDARGHGKTKLDESTPDFSLDQLSDDLVRLLRQVFPDRAAGPTLVLVGHSMGGAVVAHACGRVQKEVADVLGVVILDVVEGSAMEALQHMRGMIASRPTSFTSVSEAIQWHVTSQTLHNLVSARVSVPPLLRPAGPDSPLPLVWRTDLSATEPFWSGWFTGLSDKFLAARAAKLLVLAGTDRLDTPLMIGQMQGKYQLVVLQDVGHCLQEDAPDRLAITLLDFLQRNDRSDLLARLATVKKPGQ